MGTIGRVLSAITSIGRPQQTPRPMRGRSAERGQRRETPNPPADSEGDSSSYGSEIRAEQNPVAQEPRDPERTQESRIPARLRPEVPLPPSLYEDLLMTGIQMGVAMQAQQTQFLEQAHAPNIGGLFPAPPQPQGEPEPEQSGAGESPSERATATNGEESDAETLQLNDEGEGSDYPNHTDTDPYDDDKLLTLSRLTSMTHLMKRGNLKLFLLKHLKEMRLRKQHLKRLQECHKNQL